MQGKRTNLTRLTLLKFFKHGPSLFFSALALLGLLVIVNYVVAIKTSYIDVTSHKINSLSNQTKSFLEKIDFDVTITGFFLGSQQQRIRMMLSEYTRHNPHITFTLHDPIRNPLIAQKYGVTTPGYLFFDGKGRTTELKPPDSGRLFSEREVTTALYRLQTSDVKSAYFTEGHGESNISSREFNGVSIIHDRLLEQNYLVESINLQVTTSIPSECSVLIIADPKTPFTKSEIDSIIAYIDDGGGVMALISPGANPNLDALFTYFGISLGNDFVYETASDRLTQMGPTSPIVKPIDDSEVTKSLANQTIVFPIARSVNASMTSGQITITRLVGTSEGSWAETDLKSAMEIRSGTRPTRDDEEQRGPVAVGVGAELQTVIPDSTSVGGGRPIQVRMAVFGSGSFIANQVITQFAGNANLFLATANWIARNERILEIQPNSAVFTPVELRDSQRTIINLVSFFIFPGALFLIGIIIRVRKR